MSRRWTRRLRYVSNPSFVDWILTPGFGTPSISPILSPPFPASLYSAKNDVATPDMRRHPWPILGFDGTLQSGRVLPRYQLPLHGCVFAFHVTFPFLHFSPALFAIPRLRTSFPRRGLRRPWLLLGRNISAPPCTEGSLSRTHYANPRKPRVTADYPGMSLSIPLPSPIHPVLRPTLHSISSRIS